MQHLEKGDSAEAMKVLQRELGILKVDWEARLHKLAGCMLCTTPESLREHLNWPGSRDSKNRKELLKELQVSVQCLQIRKTSHNIKICQLVPMQNCYMITKEYHLDCATLKYIWYFNWLGMAQQTHCVQIRMPDTVMMPEARLEELLEQALTQQLLNAELQGPTRPPVSLLTDLSNNRLHVPTKTVQVGCPDEGLKSNKKPRAWMAHPRLVNINSIAAYARKLAVV